MSRSDAALFIATARRAGRSAARWLFANGPELYRGRHVLNAADAARRAWHFALLAESETLRLAKDAR